MEQFVKDHGIGGCICESAIFSAVFLPERTRCFEVALSCNGITVSLSAYVGLHHPTLTVPAALRHLAEVSQHYDGEPDFATWDDEYCEQLLGREVAEGLYDYHRETYKGLVELLGKDLYQELVALMNEVGENREDSA
jgi:hypothetical protein